MESKTQKTPVEKLIGELADTISNLRIELARLNKKEKDTTKKLVRFFNLVSSCYLAITKERARATELPQDVCGELVWLEKVVFKETLDGIFQNSLTCFSIHLSADRRCSMTGNDVIDEGDILLWDGRSYGYSTLSHFRNITSTHPFGEDLWMQFLQDAEYFIQERRKEIARWLDEALRVMWPMHWSS